MKKTRKPIDPTNALYAAINAYVKSKGGSIVVIGGIQIQQWPDDLKFNYTVAIKCTGQLPKFAETNPIQPNEAAK